MQEYIFEVNEADFDTHVLERSTQLPVIVIFTAPWCAPCEVLNPMLERLVQDAEGALALARVNVDENPRLAARFEVKTLPLVRVFVNRQVVAGFAGMPTEAQLRQFVRRLAPNQGNLQRERGLSLVRMGRWAEAEAALRAVLAEREDDPAARLGLVKALLAQGRAEEALGWLTNFPPSKEYSEAQMLRPLAEALRNAALSPEESDDPLEAIYRRALRLVAAGNLPAAMDGLLEVLRRDKRYRQGEAHQVALAVLALMDPDASETRQYRQELAMVLF